jgi:hypothetical protein
MAKIASKGADGNAWQVEVGGDLCKGLAVEVAADDLLAGGEWNGARHGRSSGFIEDEYPKILPITLPRGYNFVSRLGV